MGGCIYKLKQPDIISEYAWNANANTRNLNDFDNVLAKKKIIKQWYTQDKKVKHTVYYYVRENDDNSDSDMFLYM